MTAALIERLEKAEAGSAELSAHVVKAALAPEDTWVEQSRFNGGWFIYERPEKPRLWEVSGPLRGASVTESIDAALALAERVLPGTTFRIDMDERPRVWAFDKEDCFGTRSTIGFRPKDWEAYADATTAPLALCIAILMAKAAQS